MLKLKCTVVVASLLSASGVAQANNVTPGTVIGVFSNVITSGNYLNSPALGETLFIDNSSSAVYSITNSTDTTLSGGVQTTGSGLQWGTYPPGYGVDSTEDFSKLVFFGGSIPSDIHQPFQIGKITYLNGTSELSTQIFGATISFYDNVVGTATYLGSDTIYINTTNNFYQATSQDADWINICGNGSNICDTRLQAVEDYEGGTGVTANLSGRIVGDPVLTIDSIALAPGQTTNGNGFISAGPQLAVPEPTSLLILGSSLAAFGLFNRRHPGRSATTG